MIMIMLIFFLHIHHDSTKPCIQVLIPAWIGALWSLQLVVLGLAFLLR